MRIQIAIVFFAAVSTTCSADERGGECTLMGCGDGIVARLSVERSLDEIRLLSLRMCRNEECIEGSLAGLPPPPDPSFPTSTGFPEISDANPGNAVGVTVTPRAGSFAVDVSWHPWDPRELADGDTYQVTLTEPSGTELVSHTEAVDYIESYPNGRECGATPCLHAEIVVVQ
jgi:hypothetical protein